MPTLPVRFFAIASLLLGWAVTGAALVETQPAPAKVAATTGTLPPVAKDSVKFLVIGDSGRDCE